eukprot:6206125-Pleurochrysis_carterae.AAC.3
MFANACENRFSSRSCTCAQSDSTTRHSTSSSGPDTLITFGPAFAVPCNPTAAGRAASLRNCATGALTAALAARGLALARRMFRSAILTRLVAAQPVIS